jgi:hypothetical protein
MQSTYGGTCQAKLGVRGGRKCHSVPGLTNPGYHMWSLWVDRALQARRCEAPSQLIGSVNEAMEDFAKVLYKGAASFGHKC